MIFEQLWDSLLVLISTPEVWSIAGLSLVVSITAVFLSSCLGIPLGIYLGSIDKTKHKRVKYVILALTNTGMGLPPVVVGLVVYLLLSRHGSLGFLSLLFSPQAMIIAQMILTLPIITGVTASAVSNLPKNLDPLLRSLGADEDQRNWQVLLELRSKLIVAVMLALGRAFSEVGAIIIVGGNIRYHTRVLTTAIITEISKGDNENALALSIILLSISFSITTFTTLLQSRWTQENL